MVKVKAYAKFNLGLHLLPVNHGNWYPMNLVNCQLDIADDLMVESKPGLIEVETDSEEAPGGEENFVFQAIKFVKDVVGKPGLGARAIIKKVIPVKAGLGGGSMDAAAALKVMPDVWRERVRESELLRLANKLGVDAYYGLRGGVVEFKKHKTGVEPEIVPIKASLPLIYVVVVVPEEAKESTKWAYENLDRDTLGKSMDKIPKLIEAIKSEEVRQICKWLHNDFEISMTRRFPIVSRIKRDLVGVGADAAILAGSGLAVVGLFVSKEQALKAKVRLARKYKEVFLGKTK